MVYSIGLKDKTESERAITFKIDSDENDDLEIICTLDNDTWIIDISNSDAWYIKEFLENYL